MKKQQSNYLDKFMDSIDKYIKNLIKNPFEVVNSWGFRFFFGVLFYIIFQGKFMLLLWISIIFESLRYLILLIQNPYLDEKIGEKIALILVSLLGFLLMKLLLKL